MLLTFSVTVMGCPSLIITMFNLVPGVCNMLLYACMLLVKFLSIATLLTHIRIRLIKSARNIVKSLLDTTLALLDSRTTRKTTMEFVKFLLKR